MEMCFVHNPGGEMSYKDTGENVSAAVCDNMQV